MASASENSKNPPELVVGSVVNFAVKDGGYRYEGTVFFFDPETSSFGIDNITRSRKKVTSQVQGVYHFNLNDAKDLRVIQVAGPNNVDDASSSVSDDKKVTQVAGLNSTNTQDDQKNNGDDASSKSS